MEHVKNEIAQLEMIANEVNEPNFQELTDLQLAIVGGGHGEVSFG